MTAHATDAECVLTVAVGTTESGQQDIVLQILCSCGHQSIVPMEPGQARSTAAALLECAGIVDGGGGLN